MPDDPALELLPLEDAAARAGLTADALLQWVMAGRLPVRIVQGPSGPTHAVRTADLNALLLAGATAEERDVELRRLGANLAAIHRSIGRSLVRETSAVLAQAQPKVAPSKRAPRPRPLPATTPAPAPAPRKRYHWWYRLYRRVFG